MQHQQNNLTLVQTYSDSEALIAVSASLSSSLPSFRQYCTIAGKRSASGSSMWSNGRMKPTRALLVQQFYYYCCMPRTKI